MKKPDLSVKILLQIFLSEIMEKLYLLHQIKAQQFYTDLGLYQQC